MKKQIPYNKRKHVGEPGNSPHKVKGNDITLGRKNSKNVKNDGQSSAQSETGIGGGKSKHIRWTSTSEGRPSRRKSFRSTIVKTGGMPWFEHLSDQEDLPGPVEVSRELIKELRSKAEKLLQEDTQTYKQTHSYGDFAWIEKVLRGGTLADKMAAYTTLLQDSAVHNMASLDALLALVSTKAKRECIMATDTLKDLFTLTLLPENRKLKKFEMHPLSKLEDVSSGNQAVMNRRLILWYFEDLLKSRYTVFLESLDKVLHDTVVKTKSKAISAVEHMLSSNPEQEQLLLTLLINKLGDPVAQVAGKVIHAVTKLLDQHPNMKGVVAQEVERFLYRSQIKERAQYYALCCLNQIILDKEDSDLALHLTKVYLGFFRGCVKKQQTKERKMMKSRKARNEESSKEVDLRLMSVTLTGLSRAAPFNSQNASYLSEHTDALFALLHKLPFNIRIQTLALLFQVDESGSERFYCALYRSLLDPGLQTSSRQAVYLNLLYRCLRKDPASLRVMAFAKRIFQVCHYLPPPLSCGLLILVGQVLQNRPEVALFKNTEKLSSSGNTALLLDDDDEEEHYEDAPEEEAEGSTLGEKPEKVSSSSEKSSWVHMKNEASHREDSGVYHLSHRNPLYSLGGRSAPFWELTSLSKHFHPTVSLFARNITKMKSSQYCGDPLQDFTLSHFLERFVYRNPKKPGSEVPSSEEPKRPSIFGKRKQYIPVSGPRKIPVNSSEYVQYARDQVPEEERFLYDFMVQEAKRKKLQKEQDDDDAQSVASDDFEMVLNKMEPGSMDKMDFATAMTGAKGSKKSKKSRGKETDDDNNNDLEDDSDDDDFEDDFDEDNEEEDFANDEDFQKAFEEYDDDLNDFAGEDFDKDVKVPQSSQKSKPMNRKRKSGMDLGDLFASAEQFSGMLEEENDFASSVARRNVTSGAVANKDRAGAKQLEWEERRHSNQQWQKRKGTGPKGFPKRKHTGNFRKSKTR